ncbi:MAG: hypothetical protein Q7R45_03825 [Sulfuricaulis sp.]|nr:hypothetical protein [Sulfuricaulis sp.]
MNWKLRGWSRPSGLRGDIADRNMVRSILRQLFVLILAVPASASAVTLEELFADFRKCDFKGFYYAPWDTRQPAHPYFLERKLKPYKEQDGIYYFKVKESLFGLPVSELIVPGTWDFHAVIFDVPPAKARARLKQRFGTGFAPSDKSGAGDAPALEATDHAPNKSILYCNEREGGL